jgi:hypothetical protein
MSPETFVAALYRVVLGREPDPQGFAAHVDELRVTGDPTQTMKTFLESDEYLEKEEAARSTTHWYRIYRYRRGIRHYTAPPPPPPGHRWTFPNAALEEDQFAVFDIAQALEQSKLTAVALVFFIGIGDYLMSTPFIEELRKRHPKVTIYGCTSLTADVNNSPAVADLLLENPCIDKVIRFFGEHDLKNWMRYRYDCLADMLPEEAIVVPVIYECTAAVRHRLIALYDGFSFGNPPSILPPVLPSRAMVADRVAAAVNRAADFKQQNPVKGVVFLHLDARSSNYTYPHSTVLASELCRTGYYVVSASKSSLRADNYFEIDPNAFNIVDSIQLFQQLAQLFDQSFYSITTQSAFWHVSAACRSNNLSLQHRFDPAIHCTHYENINILSFCDYPGIPRSNIIISEKMYCSFDDDGHCTYDPFYVLRIFESMFARTNGPRGIENLNQ